MMSTSATCWIDGVAADSISTMDRALQFGHGVFETVLVHEGRPLLWGFHLDRLSRGAHRLSLKADHSFISETFEKIIGSSTRKTEVYKILLTGGVSERGYELPITPSPRLIIQRFDHRESDPVLWQTGLRVRVCNYRLPHNPVLAGFKHLNRLDQVLARAEWSDEAINEGILLDANGLVIEAISSNLFLLKGNTLFTPELDCAGVAGTMRRFLLENCESMAGLKTEESRIQSGQLATADGLFLANSVRGIMPIGEVIGIYNKPLSGQIRKLAEAVSESLGYRYSI